MRPLDAKLPDPGRLITNGKVAKIVWADLIGVPWVSFGRDPRAGLDCFGLVLVVQRRLGRTVRDVIDYDPLRPGVAIRDHASQWRPCDGPGAGRVCSLRMVHPEHADHVGVLVERGTVLHTLDRIGAALSPLEGLADRIVGWYEPVGPTVHVIFDPDPIGGRGREEEYVPWRPVLRVRDACRFWPRLGQSARDRAIIRIDGTEAGPDDACPVGCEVSVWLSPGIPVPIALTVATGLSASTLAIIGNVILATALGALTSLISTSAPPKLDKATDDGRPGFNLNGQSNTVANGTTMPVVYGAVTWAGQILQLFTETNDQFETTLFALISFGEGPIKSIGGFTSDQNRLPASAFTGKAIAIDGNPISAYPKARVSIRMGATRQDPMQGFDRTVVEFGQTQELRSETGGAPSMAAIANNSQTFHYITTQAIDGFAIAIEYPIGLYKLTTTADEVDYSVVYTLRYRRQGVASSEIVEVVTHGPSHLKATHLRTIKRLNLQRDVWEIWITRMSINDAETTRRYSTSKLNAFREYVSDNPIAHNSKACIGIELPATGQQSGNVPLFSAQLLGKVVNIWDGVSLTAPTFTRAYSNNPAWVLLDMLLDPRYGGGTQANVSQVNLTKLKALADYCDESLTTSGVVHPRWSFNHIFDTQAPLDDQMALVEAMCRSVHFYSGNQITWAIERAGSPVQLFTMGNILAGSARRRMLPTWNRPNLIRGQYQNVNLDYDSDVAQLTSATGGATSAYIAEDVSLDGITTAEQAYRAVKYLLNVSAAMTEAVAFRAPIDAVLTEPGDLFSFAHDAVLPGGSGGRIDVDSPDLKHVKIDRDLDINAAGMGIAIRSYDSGTGADIIQTALFSDIYPPGAFYTSGQSIPLAAGLTVIPKQGDVYVFGVVATARTTYRATLVRRNADQTVDIEGIIYTASVYSDDPGVIEAFTDQYPDSRLLPDAVTRLRATEAVGVAPDGGVIHGIDVSFSPVKEGLAHDVWIRQGHDPDAGATISDQFGAWWHAGTTTIGQLRVTKGVSKRSTYEVSVTPRSSGGRRGEPSGGVFVAVIGNQSQPAAPTGLSVVAVADGKVRLKWTASTSPDVSHYAISFRLTDPRAFFFAHSVEQCVCGTEASVWRRSYGATPVGGATGYWLVTAISRSGQRSIQPAYVADVGVIDVNHTDAASAEEDTATWPGTITNGAIDGVTVLSNAGATSFVYETATTFLITTGDFNHAYAFVDAQLVEIDSTVFESGYLVGSVHSQRLIVGTGVLLDVPDPDQYLPVGLNAYPIDSPGSRTNFAGGAMDWDATCKMKVEVLLDGGTYVEATGPIPCGGVLKIGVRVTFTMPTGEGYRVRLNSVILREIADLT